MSKLIAHNLKISDLIRAMKAYEKQCKYLDAYVEDELTLKFRPSNYQGEDVIPPDREEPDINQTIV